MNCASKKRLMKNIKRLDYPTETAKRRTDFRQDRGAIMKRFDKRAGVTLIELLVVASIILSIMAISIPTIKPMLESRGTYNAASVVSTYLNRARTRAMVSGRPCGVFFEVFTGTSSSVLLRQVEVPPMFTGYTEGATADVVSKDDTNIKTAIDNYISSYITANNITDSIEKTRVRHLLTASCFGIAFNEYLSYAGKYIRLDSSGQFFEKVADATDLSLGRPCWIVQAARGVMPPAKRNVPFEIQLYEKPTMTAPVGLPQETVVDLTFSGIGSEYLFENDYQDTTTVVPRIEEDTDRYTRFAFGDGGGICIMFSPSGEVLSWSSRSFHNGTVNLDSTIPPAETVYLLIGKWDLIPQLRLGEDSQLWNYAEGNNFWISINPTTGIISTTPVNTILEDNYYNDTTKSDAEIERRRIFNSREFARELKRNYGGGR